jgi:hypothetical protein
MEIRVFWDVKPRTLADCYGGTHYPHLRFPIVDNIQRDNLEGSIINCYAKCPVNVLGLHDI